MMKNTVNHYFYRADNMLLWRIHTIRYSKNFVRISADFCNVIHKKINRTIKIKNFISETNLITSVLWVD